MEARIVAATGMQFAAIKAGRFRRMHGASTLAQLANPATLGLNARDSMRIVQGVVASVRLLRSWKPDVVFLKGGHVCLPVGLAARLLKIPYIIHESDLEPGLTNRILARWAAKIAVGFPVKGYHDFDPARIVFTGSPVRPELLKAHRLDGLARFKLNPSLPVLLVTGGSQGAAQINDAVLAALPQLLPHCQIIHQTGELEFERVRFELGRMGKVPHLDRYHPRGFILKDMPGALAAADVVVGRAGAQTIAELAVLGKPAVLIPNYEMAGHQVQNARLLARAGAVRVLDGRRLTVEQLSGEVIHLLEDEKEQDSLSRGIRQFGRPDAAVELAKLIYQLGGAGEAGNS